MIKIEHPFTKKKMRLSAEEKDLAEKIKVAARHKHPSLMRWYLDQLGEHLQSGAKAQ